MSESLPETDGQVSRLVQRRRSAAFLDLCRSSDEAVVLAAVSNALGRRDVWPVASAGSLRGTRLYLVGPLTGSRRRFWEVNLLRSGRSVVSSLAGDEFAAAFSPDADTQLALPGCHILVLSQDLEANIAKYGLRGYRFGLLEIGSLMHGLLLSAAEIGLDARVVGGFCEQPLARLLRVPSSSAIEITVLFGATA